MFDDNAEFRQKSVFELRDRTQEDKNEVEAAEHNLVSHFFLQPLAKYQGITLVVFLLLLLLLVHHLVHVLFKRNFSEKILPDWESNRGPSAPPLSFLSTELQPHSFSSFEKLFI